jgi:hypothetical protein
MQLMHDEYVRINCCGVGEVNIKLFNFTKYDPLSKYDVGSRTQLPLKLSFAITVHKCQGMILDRLEVDCKGMFEYGQLVVSVSRAVNKKGLRILNFSSKLVVNPPDSIAKFFQNDIVKTCENDLSCYTNSVFHSDANNSLMDVEEGDTVENTGDNGNDNVEDDDDQLMVDLLESMEQQDISTNVNLEDEFELPLPTHLNTPYIVVIHQHENPQTDFQNRENEVLTFLRCHSSCLLYFFLCIYGTP